MRMILPLLIASVLAGSAEAAEPVRLIFDTDMGNDIDDALALGTIHALQSRGECQLLAVTLSKSNPLAARYCDAVNTFYGRGDIPVGLVRDGKTPEPGNFIPLAEKKGDDGNLLYPHEPTDEKQIPDATEVLRKTLAAAPDGSVVIAVVGFSTNLARLLDTKADDVSPLDGRDLVAKKVTLLSMMAGHFGENRPKDFREYNAEVDRPSTIKVFAEWPTPIVVSGFEIGEAIEYPATSIERDYAYVPHHPLKEAYELYLKMPYDRATWDLTSVLYAVRPDRDYFGVSDPGELRFDGDGFDIHNPGGHSRHRYLTVTPEQITRVRETLVMLSSEPPTR